MAGREATADDTALQPIPVVVAVEAEPAAPLPWYARASVPRIVDYLIVAVFMFFWL
jgi:hypothetical protein